ncbi:hypothetical protein [Luteolibacter yonseiensis]
MVRLLPLVLPVASGWVAWHERRILRLGVPLSAGEIADAARMGVRHPEKIRLLKTDDITVLNGVWVRTAARWIPSVSPHTVGLSLRYGIYVRSRHWRDRRLIAHECVHTAQYERLGGIRAFLRAYFTECILSGYPGAPLEQEAIMRSSGLQPDQTDPFGWIEG